MYTVVVLYFCCVLRMACWVLLTVGKILISARLQANARAQLTQEWVDVTDL